MPPLESNKNSAGRAAAFASGVNSAQPKSKFLADQQINAGDSKATMALKGAEMVAGEVTGVNSIERLRSGTYDVTHGSLKDRLKNLGGAALDVGNLALTYTPIVGEGYMAAKAGVEGAIVAGKVAKATEATRSAVEAASAASKAAKEGKSAFTALKEEQAARAAGKSTSRAAEEYVNQSARAGERLTPAEQMTDTVAREASAYTSSAGKNVEDINQAGINALKANEKDISARMKGPGEVSEAPAIESVVNGYTPPPIGTKAAKPIFEKPLPTDPVIPKIIKPGDAPKFVRELSPEEIKMGKDIQKQMIREARDAARRPGPRNATGEGMRPVDAEGAPGSGFGLPTDTAGGVRGGRPGPSGAGRAGHEGTGLPDEGPAGGGGRPRGGSPLKPGPGPAGDGVEHEGVQQLVIDAKTKVDLPDGHVKFSPTAVRRMTKVVPGLGLSNITGLDKPTAPGGPSNAVQVGKPNTGTNVSAGLDTEAQFQTQPDTATDFANKLTTQDLSAFNDTGDGNNTGDRNPPPGDFGAGVGQQNVYLKRFF